MALLPANIYPATLDEIESMFVTQAPFGADRRVVFDAFVQWLHGFDALFPGSTMWLNGGFVTHKTWAPPRDVDVAVHADASVVSTWDPALIAVFRSFLTDRRSGTQPMGGLVDAFWFVSGDPQRERYWEDQWGKVRGPDRSTAVGVQKGFVEVIR